METSLLHELLKPVRGLKVVDLPAIQPLPDGGMVIVFKTGDKPISDHKPAPWP